MVNQPIPLGTGLPELVSSIGDKKEKETEKWV
jgi:hypothetical protein